MASRTDSMPETRDKRSSKFSGASIAVLRRPKPLETLRAVPRTAMTLAATEERISHV